MIHRPRTTDNSAHHLNRSSAAALAQTRASNEFSGPLRVPCVARGGRRLPGKSGRFLRRSTRLMAGSDYVTGGGS
jgi:hypothetical protein